jgi:hypothetical protein
LGPSSLSHAPLPNGSGFARYAREMGCRGRIIVIVGNLTVKELRAYEPHAISGFFSKPFDSSILATMLLQTD